MKFLKRSLALLLCLAAVLALSCPALAADSGPRLEQQALTHVGQTVETRLLVRAAPDTALQARVLAALYDADSGQMLTSRSTPALSVPAGKTRVLTLSFPDAPDRPLLLRAFLCRSDLTPLAVPVAAAVPDSVPEEPPIPELAGVPDDWENDLWLNSDFERLSVGETCRITARRIPELVADGISNEGLTLPPFRYRVLEGDDVVQVSEDGLITAKKEGLALIQVRYDEVTPDWSSTAFGACSPVNYAYVTVEVNDHPAPLTLTTDLNTLNPDPAGQYHTKATTYDTIYFTEGDSVPFTFSVALHGPSYNPQNGFDPDLWSIQTAVTCNGIPLEAQPDFSGGTGSSYTAQLKNRTNVIRITGTLDGKTISYGFSVDARKVEVEVRNLNAPGQPLQAGHTARISFRGITLPVAKLATIYNPGNGFWGAGLTQVHYSLDQKEYRGGTSQYDLAHDNSIQIKFPAEGTYRLTDGCIDASWFGSRPDAHKALTGPGEPNLNAEALFARTCRMPDLVIQVGSRKTASLTVEARTIGKGDLLKTLHMDVTDGQICWPFLQKALDSQGISYVNNDPDGNYISAIGGLAEKQYGSLSGWMYTVNGVFPNTGVNSCPIRPGDVIRLRYTQRDTGADLQRPLAVLLETMVAEVEAKLEFPQLYPADAVTQAEAALEAARKTLSNRTCTTADTDAELAVSQQIARLLRADAALKEV